MKSVQAHPYVIGMPVVIAFAAVSRRLLNTI